MNNQGIMNRDSRNAQAATACLLCTVTTEAGSYAARRAELEWHHLAGHSSGRPRIGVYGDPDCAETRSKIQSIIEAEAEEKARVKAEKAAEKAAGLPTSKAGAWRWLADKSNHVSESDAVYRLEVKDGKYGWFVPTFGEPDEVWFYGKNAAAVIGKVYTLWRCEVKK